MRNTKESIRRLGAIYTIIHNSEYPSKKRVLYEVCAVLGYPVSESTVDKDLFCLRIDFDVDIKYSKAKDGYILDKRNGTLPFVNRLFEYLNIDKLEIIEEHLIRINNENNRI